MGAVTRCRLKMTSPYFAEKDYCTVRTRRGVENRCSLSVLKSRMSSSVKPPDSDTVGIKEEKEEHCITSDETHALVANGSQAGKSSSCLFPAGCTSIL